MTKELLPFCFPRQTADLLDAMAIQSPQDMQSIGPEAGQPSWVTFFFFEEPVRLREAHACRARLLPDHPLILQKNDEKALHSSGRHYEAPAMILALLLVDTRGPPPKLVPHAMVGSSTD